MQCQILDLHPYFLSRDQKMSKTKLFIFAFLARYIYDLTFNVQSNSKKFPTLIDYLFHSNY